MAAFGLISRPDRMGVARHRPLRLRPAKHRCGPGRPAFRRGPLRAGIGLVAEVQEADVPERLRAEPADLDVVLDDGPRLAQPVRRGSKNRR